MAKSRRTRIIMKNSKRTKRMIRRNATRKIKK